MKVSTMCFCLFFPFLVLFVTETFAMCGHYRETGYAFLGSLRNTFPTITPSCQTASCPAEEPLDEEAEKLLKEEAKEAEEPPTEKVKEPLKEKVEEPLKEKVEEPVTEKVEEPVKKQSVGRLEKEKKKSTPRIPITNSRTFKVNDFQRGFTQKLDHFDSTDTRYWTQRYHVRKGNYKKGKPVYLLVGGLGEIQFCDLESGIWNHFAKESDALLLHLEHRFYGKSYATSKDYSTEYLVHLNTPQALADLAYFIDEMTLNNPDDINIPPDATWIALGSSYGGTLAALLKLKFPHKIKAVVAIDAPLLPTVAFEEFYVVVEKQCKQAKVQETVKNAFNTIKRSLRLCEAHDLENLQSLINKWHKTFNFCENDLSKDYEVDHHKVFLLWSLITTLGLALQYGNEYGRTVKTDVINILNNKNETPDALDRFGAAVKLVLESHKIKCLSVNFGSLVDNYKNPSLDAEKKLNYILFTGLGNRQNVYQHCTEWGHFETAYKEHGLFAKLVPKDFYGNLCKYAFERRYSSGSLGDAIKRTTMFYGGQKLEVNNVIFIIRNDDFWNKLGFPERKSRKKITEDGSIVVYLKTGNGEQSVNQKFINNWKYILQTMKKWSVGKTEKDDVGGENDVQLLLEEESSEFTGEESSEFTKDCAHLSSDESCVVMEKNSDKTVKRQNAEVISDAHDDVESGKNKKKEKEISTALIFS